MKKKKTPKPRVGSKIRTWVSGRPDGMATILKVEPYTGLYKQWFTWNLTVTAENTMARSMTICR